MPRAPLPPPSAGEFEAEREGWLAQVERLSVSNEEQHKVEWELRKRRDEVRELQKVRGARGAGG